MDISWHSSQLLSDPHVLRNLPADILDILLHGTNVQYLDTLSKLALDLNYINVIFVTHQPIFVEVCSRWLAHNNEHGLSALAALARILPSAPYLSVYAKALFREKQDGALEALRTRRATALHDLPAESLHPLLLALLRLLNFDNEAFASEISPAQLQVLFHHPLLHIRYLAIKTMCLYLHASDASLVSMLKIYLGEDEIAGQWEDKIIDYTFFSLWEDKRLKDLDQRLQDVQNTYGAHTSGMQPLPMERAVCPQDLSRTTACIGGVLVPRLGDAVLSASSLLMTGTMKDNMRMLAEGVNTSKPLLVTGFSGAGKTLLVSDVARELGKSSSMVTLHINQQTDAKLLIGMYTSAKTRGSFSWCPGVLTTAVMEGRWVFIEDLDRAPTEIISILLPLLERRELFIPNWGDTVHAAPGFKLIATVRSSINVRGEEVISSTNMIGIRHWLRVPLRTPANQELAEIIVHRFPILHAHVPRFMKVYATLKNIELRNGCHSTAVSNISKPLGPQDILRWCGRVESLLLAAGMKSGSDPISDSINDCIFLDAVDCFFGALASGLSKDEGANLIAQGLHMPENRVQYCLAKRKPHFELNGSVFRIGRIELPKRKRPPGAKPLGARHEKGRFAITTHVLRILESVAVAIKQTEPCLLVGETGTGKTTIVQQLADALDHRLTVVNLSQQSEAGDLLGGYKPVNMRALAVPMAEEFNDLLVLTFPSKRNQHYIDIIGKSISKGRWSRALTLWQEALRMIEPHFQLSTPVSGELIKEPLTKKRKLQSSRAQELTTRWDKFASDVQTFQMHLASGSRGFAFSFVEGNIVKAARRGDWVLLDEINLASPDTLESLVDLFSQEVNGGPSILLAETGDTERIHAHKDFRIFGAMNPATDIGKRDLPTSLRSKFSEIFVEAPDKDLDNLVPVVKAYLGDNHNHSDVRAATDVAQLYMEIKMLAAENRLADGSNQKPHFSLRTLTRTMMYALEIAPIYGLRRALFEGFAMSFLTVLDRESELLLQPRIDKHILGSQKNSKAALHQAPRLPQDGKDYVQFRHYWIPRGADVPQQQAHYIITPFIERNLLSLVRATSTRKFPVLLQGPTSSGKTSMVEYLARISGNKFVRINNHEHTDLQEYLGTYVSGPDGQLQYQEGVLVDALREGYWVVLDELNLAPTDVLEALNRLLDDNRELLIPETQQVVRPHENFMLFATQNPPGMYGGRKVLSRAFRNRFLELHFDDIPEDELETILRERSQIAPSFCSRIVSVYKRLSILRQSERLFERKNSFATLRDLFRWALRDADDREQLALNGFLLLAERVRNQEERLAVKRAIEDVMKVKIDEDQVYGAEKMEKFLSLSTSTRWGVVWTQSMRRLYVLVTEALKNNEPVLLVGETGSGKTTICQVIAEITKIKLHIVNAHQNMETSDLIGAQRPIRNKALAEAKLVQELTDALKSCDAYEENFGQDLRALMRAYEALQCQAPARLSDEACSRIDQCKTQVSALFEWADGSLVHAMRKGQYFLLDEISLADDSVLERLNSVLEHDRTLFLAEKGSNDALVESLPGFQFLATMNPGGDYGKRELSPALRNRFTEVWVPNVSNVSEMLEIAQAKLQAPRIGFSKSMVDFAAWYASIYNVAAPFVSIRDLLAWIDFFNSSDRVDPYFALLHGAAMVYIDGLGANPASKTAINETAVSQERATCLSKLDEIFDHKMSPMYIDTHHLSDTNSAFGVGPFSLEKKAEIISEQPYSLQAPTTMANAMKIVRALQLRKPVLLEGSPGVGKTTLVAALAHAIGVPLTRINLSDQTDLMDLFGSDVPIEGAEAGNFGWRDAPFLRAMQRGEWVLLDEMNLASQAVLEGLNACLDHRGEVYVSELDQTFSTHPDFVVFAAQNPHHQGGGRKGLPASFVDRFTVVYADAFTPEDLLTVCSVLFPDFPTETMEKMMHCVTGLSQLLQRDRRIGVQGGPWEINLRDILRWLQLSSSHDGLFSAGRPADYQRLLFLQRFRTSNDVAAVSMLLQEHQPHNDLPHGYFQGKSTDMVEIGLGVLVRNKFSQPTAKQHGKITSINLPIAESVMLCVQNNWPCLLVGASGSGKTNLITQLACSVGADIVDLSLNPDMDTMDLVGGYEQLNPEREIAGFVKRLREYTRRAFAQQLLSASGPSSSLLQFQAKQDNATTNLPDLLEQVHNIARQDPTLEFSGLLEEGYTVVQQSTVDSRARFEWVDGILVKALKRGKWLILDNANLCSPSVLDRLNSLLEPNQFLAINEHRNLDGSAQIVKPHPDFRLFLTMNPLHGELSRAMRNRSIELFIPAQAPSPKVDVLSSSSESTVSRFDLFQAFDWNNLDDIEYGDMLAICFDHLSFSDFSVSHRWGSQFLNGLHDLPPSKQDLFSQIAKVYQQMVEVRGKIMVDIQKSYNKIVLDLDLSIEFNAMQTIHPFNNPILLSLPAQNPLSAKLRWLGKWFDLLVETHTYRHKLAFVSTKSSEKARSHMSRFERSIASVNSRQFKADSTHPVGPFLKDMGIFLICLLDNLQIDEVEDPEEIFQFARDLLLYIVDMFDLVQSSAFDEGIFQTFQSVGRSMVAIGGRSGSLTAKLAHELGSRLDTFNDSWQLCSGLVIEELWATFKPITAKTAIQLEFSTQVRDLADRFDALKWSSGAFVHELDALRHSIAHIHDAIESDAIANVGQLRDVSKNLQELEGRSALAQIHTAPYFQSQFEALCQYDSWAQHYRSSESRSKLDLLAGRDTADLMTFGVSSNAWTMLSQMRQLTGVGQSHMEMVAVRRILAVSLLRKLENITELPLRSLGLLRTEMCIMAETIATYTSTLGGDPLQHMETILKGLQQECKNALGIQFESADLEQIKGHIDQIPYRLNLDTEERSGLDFRSTHLHACLDSAIGLSDLGSPSTLVHNGGELVHFASSCVQFFTGCLLLYVPDRPFDPALRPIVERMRHVKRRTELENKLRALRDFEMVFSGQSSSYRIQLVEQSLQKLGAEPEMPSVVRPVVSELGQLQAEFNSVLKTIIMRSPNLSTLQLISQGYAAQLQELRLLRLNIAQALSRLSNGFRAYEDVTKPLAAMLQGLDVGLALALLEITEPKSTNKAIKYICETTPFLGAQPENLTKITFTYIENQNNDLLDSRQQFLKSIAVIRSVDPDCDKTSMQTMFESFHSLYQEWKQQLSQDQQQKAANSSLYRYRGGEEDSNEADELDFLNLFPDYSSPYDESTKQRENDHHPRLQAQRLANLQRGIFQSKERTSQRILSLLQDASQNIARLWEGDQGLSRSPVPAETLLSGLILSIDEHSQTLLGRVAPENLYNFYTDANISEVQKLVALVYKIQAKFLDLREAWPEHATLGDVLRTSQELLGLRHTEPLAKIMTKAEQLHGYVHEWQVVSSKQYTASLLYDQLTGLLVSWRRLELSTWGRLLDMEDKKCSDDADAWWFIAYEVLIAVPLSMANAGEDLRPHSEHIFTTLGEFLATTSIGQYSHRLGMIDCFKSHLGVLAQDLPSLKVILHTIENFLGYYKRFENAMQEVLRKGRLMLAKDMKEILLLASWKDTNIIALRSSAKRSHHKLFKVVRKYRALLAQQADSVLMRGMPEYSSATHTPTPVSVPSHVCMLDPRALQAYQQYVPGWQTKPARFRNSHSTAINMSRMSQPPTGAVDVPSYLDDFGDDLLDRIKLLQKETLSKVTKENSEAIKHLKARKRNLYAKTLKDIRQMGFRSNMNADALAKQASLSVIFANNPAPLTTHCGHEVTAAEHHLHNLLYIMPRVKERTRNHSEDLSNGEVAQSIGYLESMISIIIRQRQVLADSADGLESLDNMIKKMQNLWSPDSYSLRRQGVNEEAVAKKSSRNLKWLPGVLEAGCAIIEKNGKLSNVNTSATIAGLEHWKQKVTAAIRAFDDLPELPSHLSSSLHEQKHTEVAKIIGDFRTQLQEWIQAYPLVGFVLRQIELWTGSLDAESVEHVNGRSPIKIAQIDEEISESSDSILVAVQRMQETLSSLPSSYEEPKWLLSTEASLAGCLKTLKAPEITCLLENAVSNVKDLDTSNVALNVAGATFALALPIIEQYRNIQQVSLSRYADFYRSLCKLASHLAQSFSQIALEGFCSPSESSASEAGKAEKLEGGTGLGEGEGAEDISKDVQDDEDLSELAQDGKRDKDKEEIEDQEDAVDMDHDELEGEMGDMSEKGEDDGSASDGEDEDIDEETGDVDDLNPSAVDEKLWDGKAEDAEKEKEGSKGKGKTEKDEQEATESVQQKPDNGQDEIEEQEDEISQNGEEEGEKVSREENEKMDPYAQEGQNLDLPEEMDLDNIDSPDSDSGSGNSDMDGPSDVEGEEDVADMPDEGAQDSDPKDALADTLDENQPENIVGDTNETEENGDAGSPVDTEPDIDDKAEYQALQDRNDSAAVDKDNAAPSDVQGTGGDMDQQLEEEQTLGSRPQANNGSKPNTADNEDAQAAAEEGQLGTNRDTLEGGTGEDDVTRDSMTSQAFKKLGDALEKWHRQQRQIRDSSEKSTKPEQQSADVDMADQEYEHLQDEDAQADTQALGAATDDQAVALDERALDSEVNGENRSFPDNELNEEGTEEHDQIMEDPDTGVVGSDDQQEQLRPGAFIAKNQDRNLRPDQSGHANNQREEDIDDLDNDLSTTHLQSIEEPSHCSAEEARRLWSYYESLTRDLSLSLTEQLRLILAPTLATKMRGDFRTGKRLNIKRIIPYIASQYKRDKIWMRRSIPSKRNYQIMLAVDDSKSMGASGSGQLAFETLALVAKSLSMLEVGEICVVGFGSEVRVAHEFDKPFSSEAGAHIFKHFGFQQNKTNVRRLVADSIALFREARRKSFNAGTDLWQLELIISDGVCEDHDTIRRLVRQAQEERIMIVFVIVDSLRKGESIMDMSQAVFEPDATGKNKIKIKRYLDGFPFQYYLVVGDVKELPGVLAQALRQWFAEVVESG